MCVCVCEGRDDSSLNASMPHTDVGSCQSLDANFFVVILHQSLPLCYLTFFSLLPSFSLKRFGSIFFFQQPLRSLNLLKKIYRSASLLRLHLTVNVMRFA